MFTAKDARNQSIEAQLTLAENIIQNAIECGFKSICISNELEESLYDEVIQQFCGNGFDVIFKIYTNYVDEIISWENGKEKDGSLISLDYRLSDENEENNVGTICLTVYEDDFDDYADFNPYDDDDEDDDY